MKFVAFIFFLSFPCWGQEKNYRDNPMPDFGPGYLTFYLDNDLFANTDRDYTNGTRISWISGNRNLNQVGSFQRALQPFAGDRDSLGFFKSITGFKDLDAVQYNYGVSLTQLMFTPEDFQSVTQPVGQRRYAGWSALGFSLHTKDDQILNSIEFLVGITGKYSFAEDAQNFIHESRGIDEFDGWDNQIPTEVTADLAFIQKRRLDFLESGGAFSVDGIGEWGARLGTFRTNALLGGMIRMGFYLPADFSDPRLSETAYAHKYFADDVGGNHSWSVYALGGFRGTWVMRDASLDGPLFRDFSTGNRKESLVGEVYAGIGIQIKGVELSYAHTWRSSEYKEEQDGGSSFGTVSVRLEF